MWIFLVGHPKRVHRIRNLDMSIYSNISLGLRDSNSARQNITERYLIQQCKEIFVICNIGRAATDRGVTDVLTWPDKPSFRMWVSFARSPT